MKLFEKIFGTDSERAIKKIQPIADKVLALEETVSKLTDKELKDKTAEFKERLSKGETLEDLLPEAFAVCREASWRVLGMKPFLVQVIGGIILHQGRIAEMKTGEGKSLTATLPLYLNALTGKGSYLVTVNDYLAQRDSQQMGKVFSFLGLTTGLIVHEKTPEQRREAYNCDITYGTNSEFGFDYLRDNMATHKNDLVQRGFNFAIVDEVDSILIDEARTPLIISGFNGKSTDDYVKANDFVKTLKKKVVAKIDTGTKLEQMQATEYVEQFSEYDYVVEEKTKIVTLTEKGIAKAEKYYGIENLSDPEHVDINHYIQVAIKAHGIFKKDIDYVIKDGKVMIVDESTGRIMDGRRYSDGIHQAIEAKEKVDIQQESKTLASITYQNLFRKFPKLSGMTGTAMTEKEEFQGIYALDVVQVPTNKPMIRQDHNDKVYISHKAKLQAIVNQVKECQAKGQPILIGTASVERSEELSSLFKRNGIKHVVLNAKYHAEEAKIVAQAGKFGAVTIATNMAGRGTDIILGGNPEYLALEELRKEGFPEELIINATSHFETDNEEILDIRARFKEKEQRIKAELAPEVQKVLDAGGLYILGSERHESRRIDNQLRGRAGRQGDVGESEFILSMEDNLMRLFGADKILNLIRTMNLQEDEPIHANILSNSIEKAQARVEGEYFNMRKSVLQFDEVLAKQRDIVYSERAKVINNEIDCTETAYKMMLNAIESKLKNLLSYKKFIEQEDLENVKETFGEFKDMIVVKDYTLEELDTLKFEDLKEDFCNQLKERFDKFVSCQDKMIVSDYFRRMVLFLLDTAWQDHMVILDDLKQGINLKAYAQTDPLLAFKLESFELFDQMMEYIHEETLRIFYQWQLRMLPQT